MRDVAVIGGGVSGCYCAYRLTSDSQVLGNIALYEASERIGGRLWSVPVAGAQLDQGIVALRLPATVVDHGRDQRDEHEQQRHGGDDESAATQALRARR